jgi:hypothetical protein
MARKRVRGTGKSFGKGLLSATALGGGLGTLINIPGISKSYNIGKQTGLLNQSVEEIGNLFGGAKQYGRGLARGERSLEEGVRAMHGAPKSVLGGLNRVANAGKLGGLKAAGRFGGKAAIAGALTLGGAYVVGRGIRAAVNKAKDSKDAEGKIISGASTGAKMGLRDLGRWVTFRGRHVFIPDKKGAKAVVKRAKGKK